MLSKGTIRNKDKNSDSDTHESLLIFQSVQCITSILTNTNVLSENTLACTKHLDDKIKTLKSNIWLC